MRIADMILVGATLVSLLSCDIPFVDNIYDDQSLIPSEETDNSFAYLDCTGYTTWQYVDLAQGTSEQLSYLDEEPTAWTFALHRYDCKTNGGGALETSFTSLDALATALSDGTYTLPSAEAFVSDVESQIITDMSGMMSGVIGYAESALNEELGKWMYVDTSDMPPTYTTSGRVYLIREANGVVSAVAFTGYSNPYYYDTKGYISFDYSYALGTCL